MKNISIKKIINNQFFRFIVISGVNTIFGLAMFSFFIFLGFHYPIAILFSTILGVLFNFQTISRLVFAIYKSSLIIKFVLVYCIVYLLNTAGVGIFIYFHMSAYLAGAIMVVPIGVSSFLLNKKLVFNNTSSL
jgi:putative flippase GtrA